MKLLIGLQMPVDSLHYVSQCLGRVRTAIMANQLPRERLIRGIQAQHLRARVQDLFPVRPHVVLQNFYTGAFLSFSNFIPSFLI